MVLILVSLAAFEEDRKLPYILRNGQMGFLNLQKLNPDFRDKPTKLLID